MKLAVLYRSTGNKLTLYDLNTRDGSAVASLYDIVRYPAVLAMTDNGQFLQMWQGDLLPMMNEIMYYAQSQ